MQMLEYMFKDNYAYLLKMSGKNHSEVARFVGVKPQTAREWAATGATPRDKTMKKLASFFNVSEKELAKGDLTSIDKIQVNKGRYIPTVSLSKVGDFLQDSCDYKDGFNCTLDVSADAFSVMQKGDSMTGTDPDNSIADGAVVVFEPLNNESRDHGIVLAKLLDSGHYTIKKLVKDAGRSYLTSINSMYAPIPVNENIEIIAFARWSIKTTDLDKRS